MTESTSKQDSVAVAEPPPPAPPPRRPRVREVSSRFMTPVASSTSSSYSPLPSTKPRSTSVQRHRRQLDMDNPLSSSVEDTTNSNSTRSPQRRHSRSVSKLFKDNSSNHNSVVRALRPDTPMIVTPRFRSSQQRSSTPNVPSAATKLLHSSGLSNQRKNVSNDCDNKENDNHNSSHNDLTLASSMRSLPDLRNSMPEDESRFFVERNAVRKGSADLSKSLDLLRSSSESIGKSGKSGGLQLPPVAPHGKSSVNEGLRKGKKGSHLDDAHILKMLHNRYLQWRFANAKAEICVEGQKREAERALYSRSIKIAELYSVVIKKRIELGLLRRINSLSTIVEAQMPHLDEWSSLEGDYTASLEGLVQALWNASVQLPIGANVRVDLVEVQQALNSAAKLMESIALNTQNFMPKASEVEILISELAKINGGERALIEDCGGLLSTVYKSQVEECSLRSQLIQQHRIIHQQQQA